MNIAIMQAAVTRRLRMTMSAERGGGLARSTANVGFQSVWLDPTVLKFACTGMRAGAATTIIMTRRQALCGGTFIFINPIMNDMPRHERSGVVLTWPRRYIKKYEQPAKEAGGLLAAATVSNVVE
jgi:hypothetical protein